MNLYIVSTLISIIFCFLACLAYKDVQRNLGLSDGLYNQKALSSKIIYQIFVFLSALPLFFISAFRYGLGTDYMYTYVPEFYHILMNDRNHYSIGFYFINKGIQVFTQDPTWLFIVCACIFIFFVYQSIYKNSPYPILSVALLLVSGHFFLYLNLMRQYVAMAILLFSIQYVIEKKLLPYIICILIATSIHATAIVFLPIYLFSRIKAGIKWSWIVVALTAIFASSISSILYYFLKFSNYEGYVGSQFDTHLKARILIIENICILAIFCYAYLKSKHKEKLYVFLNIQMVTALIFLFTGWVPLMDRVGYFYSFVQIISIPCVIREINNKLLRKFITILLIIAFGVLLYYTAVIKGDNQVIPYNNVFQAGVW